MEQEIELVNGKFRVKGKKEVLEPTKPKPVPKQYSQEVLTLRDRVIAGNKKLNDAWEVLKGMDHESQEWKNEFERWHQANVKLSELCSQLKFTGYTDCLYIDENGRKMVKCLEQGAIGCRVCPSQFPYWEQEFSELPSAGGK